MAGPESRKHCCILVSMSALDFEGCFMEKRIMPLFSSKPFHAEPTFAITMFFPEKIFESWMNLPSLVLFILVFFAWVLGSSQSGLKISIQMRNLSFRFLRMCSLSNLAELPRHILLNLLIAMRLLVSFPMFAILKWLPVAIVPVSWSNKPVFN